MTVKTRDAHMRDDTRIALLENTIGYIHETLERIEKNTNANFNKMEGNNNNRFNSIERQTDNQFNKMEELMKELRQEGRSHFRWTMGYLIGFFLGTFSVITAFILKIVHFI